MKHQLLTQQSESASSASLGALVAGPGREILYDMLRAPDRSDVRHHLVERLLRGLGEATLRSARSGVPGSEDARRDVHTVLTDTVRDPSWQCSVRNRALIELIWVLEDLAEGPSILLELLRDLAEGNMPEDEKGSLGLRLLDRLYPQHVGADRIWDYVEQFWTASPPTVKSWDGDKHGWVLRLLHRSAPEDLRILLETLVRNAERLNTILAQNGAEHFAERLLTRGLELFGEETEPAELYQWFELVQAADDWPGLVLAHREGVARKTHDAPWVVVASIYGWLRRHRDIQLALVLEGLKRNATLPRDRALDHAIGVKFLGDKVPAGFRRWCLEKAVALAETNVASAVELAFWTVTERDAWGPPLNDEEVLAAVQNTPLLLEWHAQRAPELARHRESAQSLHSRERREAYASSIREQLSAVEAGQEPPELLHELGRVYLGGFEAGGINQARTGLGLHLGDENDLREVRDPRVSTSRRTNGFVRAGRNRCPACRQRIATLRRRVPRRTHREGRYTCGAVCTSRRRRAWPGIGALPAFRTAHQAPPASTQFQTPRHAPLEAPDATPSQVVPPRPREPSAVRCRRVRRRGSCPRSSQGAA